MTTFFSKLIRGAAAFAASFLILAPVTTPAHAAGDDGGWLSAIDHAKGPKTNEPHVRAKIIAENTSLTPQAENRLAVVLEHADGWHTYWRMPGDAGLVTEFTFTKPSNIKVTPPRFPLPERIRTGELIGFGYEGTTAFPFTVEVPRQVRFGDRVTISVKVDYLACADVCVPGTANASIRLPLAVVGKPSGDEAAIKEAESLIPETIATDAVRAVIDENRIRIEVAPSAGIVEHTLDFFPLEDDVLKLATDPVASITPENRTIQVEAAADFAAEPREKISGVLVADGGPAEGGWAIETEIPLVKGAVAPLPVQASAAAQTNGAEGVPAAAPVPAVPVSNAPSLGALTAIFFAFVGGIILNLMPCVFPVLSLKLLQLVDAARKGEAIARHGIAFTAGVCATMLALSGVLLALRGAGAALGWGFQLQNPAVVAGLILLFGAITANLAGLYEFTLGTGVANMSFAKAKKDGVPQSFLTGVLAVIIASPCTAPFMGAALGYALTETVPVAVAVFLALGLGMSLPWLLLCIFPAWAAWLPKPGPWMETFRKVMAVPMALAILWLGWVLSKQVDFFGMMVVVAGLASLIVALWLLGREQWGRGKNRPLMLFLLVLSIAGAFTVSAENFRRSTPAVADDASGWGVWSEAAVSQALASGRPVFVDFTAAWCVTCQANKVAALRTNDVARRMDELGYVRLTADWTNQNPDITKVLAQFGRSGVPLYLIYRPDGRIDVLPELLTKGIVLDAL